MPDIERTYEQGIQDGAATWVGLREQLADALREVERLREECHRLRAESARFEEAWRWLAWLDGDRRNDGTRQMVGTPYQAAQRIAARLHAGKRVTK